MVKEQTLNSNTFQISLLLFFSVILVIMSVMQFLTQGWHLFAWDMLLISGLVLLVIGIWLSLHIPHKMDVALTRLINRGVLKTDGERWQKLQIDLQRRTMVWACTGGLIVASAILLAFFVAFGLPLPAEKISLTILEVAGGFLAGWYLGRMASNGRLGLLLKEQGIALQVQPGYLDGAAGLTRIIHQPKKSTRENLFGGQMILTTPISQDHHAPKARSSDGLDSVQSGLSVVSRRTSSWQPPRADHHRFVRDPPEVSMALTGPATSDAPTLTTLHSALRLARLGTTRATKSGSVLEPLARGHPVSVSAIGSWPS